MAEARAPAIHSIPVTRPFADSLVAGLMAQHGRDRRALARGIILVPNNRAGLAIRDAFVRQAEGGLLLPRLVAIGDPDLDERAGAAIDAIDDQPIPPAIDPLARQLMLARMLQQDGNTDAAEAMRLAADLARVLDQLTVEEKDGQHLKAIELESALSQHWEQSLARMKAILELWPEKLRQLGRIDLTQRRNLLLDRTAARWAATPPAGFVVAAGISTAAPAVARLLRTVAFMPNGSVVLAGLDPLLSEEDWAALAGEDAMESHPQFHLRELLDRMKIERDAVRDWGTPDKQEARASFVSQAFALPDRTRLWADAQTRAKRPRWLRALELATPAEEGQAIALAIREALETPARTVALVTPDRDLATRVSAHLRRWGIEADDSAGRPLSATPPGSLLLALVSAAAESFAPAALMALLKHPMVRAGEARQAWLDGTRALDLALRGPRPAPGLEGLNAFLMEADAPAAQSWWHDAAPLLAPLEGIGSDLASALATLREVATALCGDALWSGQAGRALGELLADLEANAGEGPRLDGIVALPQLLRQLIDGIAIRPAYGGHARTFIWGLIEARLQSADVMILGGLNEGVWPQLPAPDPWLAPPIRREFGLPGLERRTGLSAHDLASAMSAPEVILTRARRDARGPAIPSRLWLRIEALTGGLDEPDTRHDRLAGWLDGLRGGAPRRARRPAPAPPAAERPKKISVTEVDRLTADPYAFYANRMMGLRALDPLDAEPGPAWRGSLIHGVLEAWARDDGYAAGALVERMEAELGKPGIHPLIRALWLPRLSEAAGWIEREVAANREIGREPILAEERGSIDFAGVTISARADRIDRLPVGGLAIVDYKTGAPPSTAQVREGFAMQLGLTGLIAERGGFAAAGAGPAPALGFDYWSLDRDQKTRKYGRRTSPVEGRTPAAEPDQFVAFIAEKFAKAAADYLLGDKPFTAKLAPQFAYGEYDQLMRLEEWEGRDA